MTGHGVIDPRLLKPFLERQRWFAGKARGLLDVRLLDSAPLGPAPARAWLTILEATYDQGRPERYAAPILRDARSGAISDALEHDETCRALLAAAIANAPLPMQHGRVQGLDGPAPAASADAAPLAVRRGSPDQSNSSLIFGDRYMLKLLRRLDAGPNVEVEIGRRLTSIGFRHAAPLVGALAYTPPGGESAALAVVQGFVRNDGTAWEAAVRDAARDLDAPGAPGARYRPSARRLGARTGELHVALAQPTDDADFSPEPFTAPELSARLAQVHAEGRRALDLLESKLGGLPRPVFEQATRLLDGRDALAAKLEAIARRPIRAERTRVHGDYHLGQVLTTGDDFLIIDFEGEPARTLDERRAKASPLKDVAGMLRSFGYAADVALDRAAGGDAASRDRRAPAARAWEAAASSAFLAGYHEATAGSAFVPAGDDFAALLDAFVLEKAFYEIAYELGSRPDWVHIPLRALVALLP